jgi:hypothetical protein
MFDCGTFHLTAWKDGTLLLPPLLSRGLALVPGDILLIKPSSEHSVFLRIFRELLAFHQRIIDPKSRWVGLTENLAGIATEIDSPRRLVIPPEAFSVHHGEALTLHVVQDLGIHGIFLSRPRPKQAPRNLRLEMLGPDVSLN